MTLYAEMYSAENNIVGATARKKATKLKVRWIDLVRPIHPPFHIGCVAEIFRWVMREGKDVGDNGTWGKSGVWEALSAKPTCVNHWFVDGFSGPKWRKDLLQRFHYLLLWPCHGPNVSAWMTAERIGIDQERILPIAHFAPMWGGGGIDSAKTESVIAKITSSHARLRESHNECHPDAVWAHGGVLDCHPDGWRLELTYGYQDDTRSGWSVPVAQQEKGEIFTDFVRRSDARYNELIVSPNN